MTFSSRLRLVLLLSATLPILAVTVIVVVGTSQQVKRMEHRDAEEACARFSEILASTADRVERGIAYVASSRSFQVQEMKVTAGKRLDPDYSLPLLSLDFLEYIDQQGTVQLSAGRPALVGRPMESGEVISDTGANFLYSYENDLTGSHPSLVMRHPTEYGYLYGGVYLDGSFLSLSEAVTRSKISFVRKELDTESASAFRPGSGRPYRADSRLYAILFDDDKAPFHIRTVFSSGSWDAVFTNFLTAVGAITIVALVLAILAGLYFSHQTRREINGLADGAMRVAGGDFSQPVAAGGEGEFSDLADSFNRMMRQLVDYRNRLIMSEKISAWQAIARKVAHEVKNPLTPISIAADDLRRSFSENQPGFASILGECTTTIKNEVNRLTRLIDRFSSFAQMPPPDIRPVGTEELLEDIRILYKPDLSSGRLIIENSIPQATIGVDAQQIRQVLINLVKNSLETDARICRLIAASGDGGGIRLVIEDDGPGFPQKIIAEGITPYFSTKEKGSGLGLLIAQRIIHDHGGVLQLENRTEGGARVIITLP